MSRIMVMQIVLVGLGGCLGSVARYLTGRALLEVASAFPLGTLVVNVVGCLAIGCLAALAERQASPPSAEMWALVVTGFLGGFTTFSAFGLETVAMSRDNGALATANVALHVGLGLAAVVVGRSVTRWF